MSVTERKRLVRFASREMLRTAIVGKDTGPFEEALERVLEAFPSLERLRIFADKHPDRYGNLLQVISRLAGFHERKETVNTHLYGFADKSDAELLAELNEMQRGRKTVTVEGSARRTRAELLE